MNVAQTIQAHVIGASRYNLEGGIKGAKIQLIQDAGPDNENRVGMEVMAASAPYELLDKLRTVTEGRWPCPLEVDIKLRLNAGGKAGIEVVDVRPVIGRGKLDHQAADKAAANPTSTSDKK